jgi:hypothetical protein
MLWPETARSPHPQLRRQRFRAQIVESHAIDQRFGGYRAKHSRRRISRLRLRGDAAKFAEAETEGRPRRDSGRFFVHSRGEPDRVREVKAPKADRQFAHSVNARDEACTELRS